MRQERKWWKIALVYIAGFCVVSTILLFGACAIGSNDLRQTHAEWDQRLAVLVKQKASIEEVRQVFLDAGEEPIDVDADEAVQRAREVLVFSARKPLWPMFMSSLVLSVQFNDQGYAIDFEIHEAYAAL